MLLNPRPPGSKYQETLADKVFDWMTEQIVSGHLRPGQWVIESEVAAHVGVSRAPVREALRECARDGLVEVRRRRGTIVSEVNLEAFRDIQRARALVDSEMIRLAILEMTDEDAEQVAALAAEIQRTVDDSTAFFHCTVRMWQLMMDLCPSQNIRDMAAMLWRRSIRYRGIGLAMPGAKEPTVQLFQRLAECARTRDADHAHAVLVDAFEALTVIFLDQLPLYELPPVAARATSSPAPR